MIVLVRALSLDREKQLDALHEAREESAALFRRSSSLFFSARRRKGCVAARAEIVVTSVVIGGYAFFTDENVTEFVPRRLWIRREGA